MVIFCTNCGNKLDDDDAFCTKCGAKVDDYNDNENKSLFKSIQDDMDKKKAKKELKKLMGGGLLSNSNFSIKLAQNGLDFKDKQAIRNQLEKEIDAGQIRSGYVENRGNEILDEYITKADEQRNQRNEYIKELFESDAIKSKIEEFGISESEAISIKHSLQNKSINKNEKVVKGEIKYDIITELEKERDKNNLLKPTDDDSIYIKNINLLDENGIGGHMYRVDFIEFLEKQNLSFDNDLITQDMINNYFDSNDSLKNKITFNKQKIFKNVHDYNVNFLKENGFGGATERGGFISFMGSKGLDFNRNKITQKLVEQYINENPKILEKISAKTKPKGALYFIDGREGTLSVFPDYIELNFTGSLMKQWLSHMGGVKRIYYHQINSIQKRDVGNFTTGTLEFELPGIVRSREASQANTENVIHYDRQWQEEANKIYDYVNNKILQLHNPNYRQPATEKENTNNNSSLSQIKEAKELLDIGAITQEEFDEIKRKTLNQL